MKRIRIAIDCDDVIVPTAEGIITAYNQAYGTAMVLKDLHSTDLAIWGAPDNATAVARVEAYLRSPEYQNAEPFEDAIRVLRRLADYHELHIVTARADFLAEATERMIAAHFPDIFSSVEYTNFFNEKARTKAEVCQQLRINVLIDDHPHHAALAAACGIDVLLFGDYPWNKDIQPSEHIRKVSGWDDVERILI